MLCTPSGKPRGNHVDATGQHCASPWPCLTLPRHLGGPLRRSALVGAALVLAACSRPSGPIGIGLAGTCRPPDGRPAASRPSGTEEHPALHQPPPTLASRLRLVKKR